VLTGIALTLWLVAGLFDAGGLRGRCVQVWRGLPWLRGTLLAVVLTLPWYLLAERRTPGFLNYFIVGEHLQRFLVSGWTGDLYGQGHAEPRGTIFWFAFLGWLPWSVVVPLLLALAWWWRRAGVLAAPTLIVRSELAYLFAWVLASLLFFAISRNILPSYILPGLPAFGLLVALLALWVASVRAAVWWLWLASAGVPVLVCGLLAINPGFMDERSQRTLLKNWTLGTPLVYIAGRPLSADFYSRGQAVLSDKSADMDAWLSGPGMKDGKPITLVMERPVYDSFAPVRLQGWRIVAEHGGSVMLRKP
jgi:4-amino-4-deoxy-L-arabinose transferase-like glycosyltransferase